ncbi:protein-tyrosine phosphatase mitochondrial 1-like protein [Dermatophagoides farinae]|uniref:Phosphatidylglycerophosphatase and protein-tyrosine phosphatase 1 n=1 Tax=Dermatophagoides farinae TaxID=6954 RepID=A0A9D4P3P4_DERFA|nr:phosphatidylglycerophosphatase and protein-tyrosine phosphatase 1-like isoform X1 [Dermatophagoides farinae]KAH7643814.1 protein-tyrosine phosphatase mitochondrial 1-like protein [Dermatophagoides farinae]
MTEKLIFYGSLAYNVVMNKFNIRKWYDRIDQHVLLGALPLRGQFPKMLVRQENVRAVISLNQDFELNYVSLSNEEWHNLGVEFLQLPTKDFVEVPSLDNLHKGVHMMMRIVDQASRQQQQQQQQPISNNDPTTTTLSPKPSIYVHCKAGRTRSATLVACYLIMAYNLSPESAVNFIRDKRPHIYLSTKHLEMIQLFQRSLNRN